jgi:D-aminoacyl-tRNA deacylase
MILIVASKRDVASLNIAKQVLNNYPFKETTENFQGNPSYETEIEEKHVRLITLNEESVHAQELPSSFQGLTLVVFVSRHSSLSGTPTLSVHTPGNLGEAKLGGLPRTVSVSAANAMREALKAMAQYKQESRLNYEVSYECTHHGPSLNVPTMFAELGSSPMQWSDLKAAEAVAHAAIRAISTFDEFQAKAVIGIGGPHYSSKFTRLALEKETAFGHMIPKYAIPGLNAEVLRQCVDKTLETVEYAVLDWKGIKGEDKSKVMELLETISLPFEKA